MEYTSWVHHLNQVVQSKKYFTVFCEDSAAYGIYSQVNEVNFSERFEFIER